MILSHVWRLQVLQNEEVGRCGFQVGVVKTLLEEDPGASNNREEVVPQGHLCLPGTPPDSLVIDGELLDEVDDGGQEGVRDGLRRGGLFLQHLVQQQLQAVLEVGEGHARPGNLPRVVAQVAADQLSQDGVQKQ